MTVEEAIKMIISGGIVTPADLRPAEQQQITLVGRSDGDTQTIGGSDAGGGKPAIEKADKETVDAD